MAEHAHKWVRTGSMIIPYECGDPECGEPMHATEATHRLNEYDRLKRDAERLEETNKGLFSIIKAYHPAYIDGCECPQCSDMPIYFDNILEDGDGQPRIDR